MEEFGKECMEMHKSIDETKIEIIEHRIDRNTAEITDEDRERHIEILREYRGTK
jgi:hypothetical protein